MSVKNTILGIVFSGISLSSPLFTPETTPFCDMNSQECVGAYNDRDYWVDKVCGGEPHCEPAGDALLFDWLNEHD